MRVELISTGDEVITGLIDDTNASWLSQEFLALGIQIHCRSTVGDKVEDLIEILEERSKKADLIIFNGGLGPTSDDNTTKAVCSILNVEDELSPQWLERIKQWHKKRNREMPESNVKQARIPKGATLIDNANGTACGYRVKINNAICIFTPGVPSELKQMFSDEIKPYIVGSYLSDSLTKVKRFFTFGISESLLQDKISEISLAENIVLGYRAYYPTIELKIISHGANDNTFNETVEKIREFAKSYIYLEDEGDLPKTISNIVKGSSFVIFDNVTEGLLGVKLAEYTSVMTVLATTQQFDGRYAKILGFEQHKYAIILDRDVKTSGIHLYINDNVVHKDYHFYVDLDVTIKKYKKDAYALISMIILYQLITNGEVSIKPENSLFIDLTEVK